MLSLYDTVLTTLTDATYSVAGVVVRKPFDPAKKTYPMLVVHEIVNRPSQHASGTGETEALVAYQIDIITRQCVDTDGAKLSAYDAGRRLLSEVADALDALALSRRNAPLANDGETCVHKLRVDGVLDATGYVYRG